MCTFRRCIFLALFSCLFISRTVQGKLVNITIDDTNGGPNGETITYSPSDAWNDGRDCNGCTAHPDSEDLYDGTWHDSTFNPQPGSNNYPNTVLSASTTFTGVAVYVVCSLARTTTSPTGNSDMTFLIDGKQAGTFVKTPEGDGGYDYNVVVFSSTGLSSGKHTLTLQNGHVDGIKALVMLDSVIYTVDDGTDSTTTTSTTQQGVTVTQTQQATVTQGGQQDTTSTTSTSSSSVGTSTSSSATSAVSLQAASASAVPSAGTSASPTDSTASPTNADSASSASSSSGVGAASSSSSHNSVPIAAIVVPVIAVLAVFIVIAFFLWRRHQRRQANAMHAATAFPPDSNTNLNHGPHPSTACTHGSWGVSAAQGSAYPNPAAPPFVGAAAPAVPGGAQQYGPGYSLYNSPHPYTNRDSHVPPQSEAGWASNDGTGSGSGSEAAYSGIAPSHTGTLRLNTTDPFTPSSEGYEAGSSSGYSSSQQQHGHNRVISMGLPTPARSEPPPAYDYAQAGSEAGTSTMRVPPVVSDRKR